MPDPTEIARQYVTEKFPEASAAFLGGSALLPSWNANHSDLDIVIIHPSHRAQAIADTFENIPVEAFIATSTDIKKWWKVDIQRGRSIILRICAEGTIIVDNGSSQEISNLAVDLFAKGPSVFSQDEIDFARYRISNYLDDLVSNLSPEENFFIATEIVSEISDFILRTNGTWSSSGKWKYRRLKDLDGQIAQRLTDTFQELIMKNNPEDFIDLVDTVLNPYGGRLMSEFIRDKELY